MARLSGLLGQGVFRRWGGVADPTGIGVLKQRARALAADVERLATNPEGRDVANIPRPLHTDWAWRPALWAGPVEGVNGPVANNASLDVGAKVFLDCWSADIWARQVDGPALAIEVSGFRGSFLSLALDLPEAALIGLSRRHLVRVGAEIEAASTGAAYARLNLRQGPNLVQLVRSFEERAHVDLDLAASDLDTERLSAGWVDLIFEAPLPQRIFLADVTVSRRPRAEF